jgi:hypothetical protein
MDTRFAIGKQETKSLDTEAIRQHFLVSDLFQNDKIRLVYSHHDRMIIGGVQPIKKAVDLTNPKELRADSFLERRELGIINIGGKGEVVADGKKYPLSKLECLYLGKGVKKVCLSYSKIYQGKSSSRETGRSFNLQLQDRIQIHSPGRNQKLSARNGPNGIGAGKCLELGSSPYPYPSHGSIPLL